MTITTAEENYLKAIFKIAEKEDKAVLTNSIAAAMNTAAASVTDMLKRLAEKHLIKYEKYRGVELTEEGNRLATILIRKHRLWEVFLVEKLGFAWDEVHDLAEQLEHVQGEALIDRLDNFLGHPRFDPHGDPIPDAQGRWTFRQQVRVSLLQPGEKGILTGVDDHATPFLQYLDQIGVALGIELLLLHRTEYDQSVQVRISGKTEVTLSEKVAQNLFVIRG
ncbi:MAG: metal-dependent transcriptional regulator [Saprospiraceae bacterium]|nr:metal-dependent transcriptional regulator [Saprospiraceae bacterium]